MDIFAIFFLACFSVALGIVITLSVQYYIFYVYLKRSPTAINYPHKNSLDYSLPSVSNLIFLISNKINKYYYLNIYSIYQ